MGRQTQIKQTKEAAKVQQPLSVLANHSPQFTPQPRSTAIGLLSYYQKDFYRPVHNANHIKSSDLSKQVMNLVRHVFGPYRVPKILHQVWSTSNSGYFVQGHYTDSGRRWYIAIASGQSVYKEHLQSLMTKKQAHLFLNCCYPFNLIQAMTYARALSHGADSAYAQRIARSKLSEANVSLDVIQFFVQNQVASIQALNDYSDYLMAVYRANENAQILGKNITLKTLDTRMEQWHRELTRAKDMSTAEWEGHPLPDWSFYKEQPEKSTWTIQQILTGKELAAEGTYMHHCVYSYKTEAETGRSSIWSMRLNGQRMLTIEVRMPPNKSGYRVVQVQGRFRRAKTAEETALIERWQRECFAQRVPTRKMLEALTQVTAEL